MDCCFKDGNNRFRYRACAIIIEDGEVLFAKNELDDYYYSFMKTFLKEKVALLMESFNMKYVSIS